MSWGAVESRPDEHAKFLRDLANGTLRLSVLLASGGRGDGAGAAAADWARAGLRVDAVVFDDADQSADGDPSAAAEAAAAADGATSGRERRAGGGDHSGVSGALRCRAATGVRWRVGWRCSLACPRRRLRRSIFHGSLMF